MRIQLVFPSWPRLRFQTHFVLPPLGVTVAAALTPPGHEVRLVDENVEPVDFDAHADLVGISLMLVSQAPRAFAIADEYRRRGVKVVIGGFSAGCLRAECGRHADAVVAGEAEGVWPQVVADARSGGLKPLYRRRGAVKPEEIPVPRRDLLKNEAYAYRGMRMADLLETSRGCRFGCFPCQVPYFTGHRHRMRDVEDVAAEMRALDNDKLYIVDNALTQNEAHERRLFKAMLGLGKTWVSHPISDKPDILKLAARAGCWYVYQAIYGPSPIIRERVKRLHDHGIAVEGTIPLGAEEHGPDIFQRMVDFLLEIELDLIEVTVLTPFPGTPFFDRMKKEDRLLHEDWALYNAENVVFKPARMSPQELAQGSELVWQAFHREQSQAARMARLFKRLPVAKGWDALVGPAEERPVPHQPVGRKSFWGKPAEWH